MQKSSGFIAQIEHMHCMRRGVPGGRGSTSKCSVCQDSIGGMEKVEGDKHGAILATLLF